MNKELTEAEITAIRDEAEKLYPTTSIKDNWLDVPQFNKREGYIAALTAERQRSKGLIDTLQGFIDGYDHDNDAHRYNNTAACRVCAATEALSTYQNSKP